MKMPTSFPDAKSARAGGVFDFPHATGGLDPDLLRMRLRDIDKAVGGDGSELLVNDPNRPRPCRRHAYVPSRMPTNATPQSSAAFDKPSIPTYDLPR
jgi:hypothetical protein